MEVFRRFTTPTLKKLYRFVLKRLVGRFLDDEISLEQLDVQLGAGRIELTDISINVSILEEILPHLSFRLARVHVGRLRVEISYAKLLTESLAFFLDDISIDVAPPSAHVRNGTDPVSPVDVQDAPTGTSEHNTGGLPKAMDTSKQKICVTHQAGWRAEISDADDTYNAPAGSTHKGEAGEGLDFLAHWIEQITSKMKIVVNNVTVRVASVEDVHGDIGQDGVTNGSFLQVQCSSVKWCDETPEAPVLLTERPRQATAVLGGDRSTKPGKHHSAALLAHKRLTVGTLSVDWCEDRRKRKRDVVRISGPTCILIKHDRRPTLGLAPPDAVLDIDVSLRHIDVTMGVAECAGLCKLSSAYLTHVEESTARVAGGVPEVKASPIKPLFRENFWYLDGPHVPGDTHSRELSFDSLSNLLEQYAQARARLAEEGGDSEGGLSSGMQSSLGQSDIFFDCFDGSEDAREGPKDAESDDRDSAKIRVRIGGLDVTLLLPEVPLSSRHQQTEAPSMEAGASNKRTCRVHVQMKRMSQTVHRAGSWIRSVAEVGTCVADYYDVGAGVMRTLRVMEMFCEAGSPSSIKATCSSGAAAAAPGRAVVSDEGLTVHVQCLPIAAVVHTRMLISINEFIARAVPQVRSAQTVFETRTSGGGVRSIGAATPKTRSNKHLRMVAVIPKINVRVASHPCVCSSEAYAALVRSVQNGTSPVGWTATEALKEAAPSLVVKIKGVVIEHTAGQASSPTYMVECTKVQCQMLLPFRACDSESGSADHVGLYFLEAFQSPCSLPEAPLKVEYGLAEDITKAGRLGVARPGDADLKFLHTWEPNDGADSGLNGPDSAASFKGKRQDHESDIAGGTMLPPHILLCELPCLAVELSRLELVVLADILVGLSSPADSASADAGAHDDLDKAGGLVAPSVLEVLVEARGATIVLHEAAEFAEDPGPHSYVLNLGTACLHLGGDGKSDEQHPAPMVTVSSADACVHETLRSPHDDGSRLLQGNIAPLLFRAGEDASSAYPTVEDLRGLGFVPVLYQTKWARGTSPLAAELALSVNGAGGTCKTITATLNLYDVTLRHTVASSWLPRLLGLVVGDVPAGRGPMANSCEADLQVQADGLGEPDGSLTKMFITVFNGLVDYMPRSQGIDSGKGLSRVSGRARAASSSSSSATEGRAVFPIGVLRVSSNMVAGARMQGFKVVIRDIALHMSNRGMNYQNEDSGLCQGALKTREQRVCFSEPDASSVQEYLETSHFVQIATLNFLDAFLRTRTQVVAPADAFAAVELWMGILHVYTCQDSLSTCQALLGEWWALVNECRAASVEPHTPIVRDTDRQVGRESQERLPENTLTSLLDDVEQDAFLPGSNKEPSRASTADRHKGLVGSESLDAAVSLGVQSSKQRAVVIEDYYCVSVKPTEEQGVCSAFERRMHEGDFQKPVDLFDGEPPDQTASFVSEEGPAQWLTAPKQLHHGDNLSMESAGETSESEDDGEPVSDGNTFGSDLPQRSDAAKRNAFSFSLPAPIEIELESRHDADNSITEEEGQCAESTSTCHGRGELKSEEAEEQSQHEERHLHGGDLIYDGESGGVANAAAQDLSLSPPLVSQPYTDPVASWALSHRNGSVCERDAAAPPQDTDAWIEDAQSSVHDMECDVAKKTAPLHGEQEARWLGKNGESNAAANMEHQHPSGHETEEFRVYPHYIPIPATAEAASLPFLSGDPLSVLGHGLEKNANEEAEMKSSDHIDQKLQFQLAIHDLSVCWRLFKGRDWIQGCTNDEGRNTCEDMGVAESRSQSRKVKRGSPSGASAEVTGRAHGTSRDNPNASYTTADISKPRKAELLDALLENYQDDGGRRGGNQARRRGSRQPRVKLLNRESGTKSSMRPNGRDTSCMLEVVLQNSSLRLDSFHPESPPSVLSNMLFSIKNLHASDTLTSSRPRKTLQHWRDDVRHPREYQQKMVIVRMTARSPSDHYCPEDTPLGDELMLKVRILPVRLSFGQHTVDFLRSFAPQAQSARGLTMNDTRGGEATAEKEASPFFISCCDVGACKVKIDYQPRAIKVKALQNGDYLELLNLFPLEGVHLTLKKLLLTGLSGWDGAAQLLLQSWVQDITSNQLHNFLAGTTAVRPLVTVGKGVADLVLLPVEQYRRDGRVLRGLRKGTQSFLRAVTVETLHTSHRVASFVARTLDDIVAQPGSRASLRGLEYYDEQPTGVLDSLEHAYDALVKEVQVAAQTVVAIPYEEQEEVMGPYGRSYVRSVARALPVAVLRPVVGASEALSCTLLGFRNYMSPVIRKEEEGRWK